MSSDQRNIGLIVFCLLLVAVGVAQPSYNLGLVPSINFNYKLKNWSINIKTEMRQGSFTVNDRDEPREWRHFELADYSGMVASKIGLNTRLAGGYLLRLQQNIRFHRSIQQFSLLQQLRGVRLAHRLRTDQTFSADSTPNFRVRYRLTSEVPLNGQAVDRKEFYVRANNEYVTSWQSEEFRLEIRFSPLLGFVLNEKNRIEVGPDYRINSNYIQSTEHRLWGRLNWFIEI